MVIMKNIFLLSFLALVFMACSVSKVASARAEFKDENFIIYESLTQKQINFEAFMNELLKQDIILLGEKHDEVLHHLAEERLAKELLKHKKINIAMEMISTDKQSLIDKAKAEGVSADKLQTAIDWDKRWNYEDYKDVVELGFYEARLSGANLSKAEISTIHKGAMPLNGVLSTTKEVKNNIKKIIAYNHKVDLNDSAQSAMLDSFVEAQQYKDRRMADVLVHSHEPALLVAGRYHVDKSIGVPLHIKDFKSKKKFAVVMLGVDKSDINASTADFVWFLKPFKDQ
ncbi:chain X [Campylobacter sp. MIT 12-5580]|nr:chain X [Campylobacter sp. MIT 12-5580]